MNPHEITRELEAELCEYTGAKYAVVVNSCTMALLLACEWAKNNSFSSIPKHGDCVIIPSRTYCSVPQSIKHAGFNVDYYDCEWSGEYQIGDIGVWDSARRFTSGMYREGQMQCVSFHASKILSDTQGGAILHDNEEADAWLRKARFDGRTEGVAPKDDSFDMIGYHAYISPDVSARLLWKLQCLPMHNDDLPNDEYPILSEHEVFK